MRALALVLSAFTGLPASVAPAGPPGLLAVPFGDPTVVAAADSLSLGLASFGAEPAWSEGLRTTSFSDPLLPEPSTEEDDAEDWLALEPEPRVDLVACELSFPGRSDPQAASRELTFGAPWPRFESGGHTDKDGTWVDYEQIPRRLERPASYRAYRYPVADAPVISGYDLDKPDEEQRRGSMRAVGHGGVDLWAPKGTPIHVERLEHQVGDAEVLYVGPLYGETVVTRHAVREGGVLRDYLVLFGHLDRVADDVRRGRTLQEGEPLGYVGNSGSPEYVHLHLEVRRLRDRIDAFRLPGWQLDAREFSVVTDPRNVLPLRAIRFSSARCAPRPSRPARAFWMGDAFRLTLEATGG